MKAAAQRADKAEASPTPSGGGGSARLAPRSYGLAFADGLLAPVPVEADQPGSRQMSAAHAAAPPPTDLFVPPGRALDPVVRRLFRGGDEAGHGAGRLRAPTMVQRRCACGSSCPRCAVEETIQPKLRVGGVGDIYEREADRVAARLVAKPAPPTVTAGEPSQQADQPAELTPERLSFGGEPLAPDVRDYFEPRLGHDLSQVRVHAGGEADGLNRQLNAYAFTYGKHVWLGSGQRQATDFVLAHELAHVVQQGGTRPLAQGDGTVDGATGGEAPTVRRLGLSDEFWIPLGAAGRLTGTDLHEELLGIARTGNINIEAPAPNANQDDWGLSYQGSIDLYSGSRGGSFHIQPGLYFEGPNGEKKPDVQVTTPRRHRRAGAAGIAAGVTFAPTATRGGSINDIAGGPEDVQVGELKPASRAMLTRGAGQLRNYREGMKQAASLTNAWAELHKRPASERWNLKEPTLLPANAVTFQRGGQDMRFPADAANQRNDTELVLGAVTETSRGTYTTRVLFNPAARGLPPIMGGLYAQSAGDGSGLWMYFGRPSDASLQAIQQNPRVSLTKAGQMEIANRVQDQVLDPLFQAPQEQLSPYRRPGPAPEGASEPSVALHEAPGLRRKPKEPAKLKDKFVLGAWQPKVAALREELFGAAVPTGKQKQVAELELLDHATNADENLAGASANAPAKALKPHEVTIASGGPGSSTGGAARSHTKPLHDMFGWLKGWTSKPVERGLGWFRQRFGTTFVWIADKIATLRAKVREKFHKAFHGKGLTGGGKAKILLKALGKALIQVARVLLHKTVGLIVGAIRAGADKQLEKMLDVDPVRLVEDKLESEFDKFAAPLENLKANAEASVLKAVEEYTGDLSWIGDVKKLTAKIGPIVEVAAIALQCGTPPGWGCLKLLLRKLNDCAMDAVLNFCPIQKEIAGIVEELGPVADLPRALAQICLNGLKTIAPSPIDAIFSEPVAGLTGSHSGEIDCEPSAPESWCPPGLFGSGGGGGSGGKDEGKDSPQPEPPKVEPVHEELQKLQQEFTPQELQGLAEMAEAANAPPDAPLTEEQVRKMRELLYPGRGLGPNDFSAMAKGQASADVEAKLRALQDWLDKQANEAIKSQLLRDFKAGKYAGHHDDMAKEKRHWRVLKPYRLGPFKNYPVLMWDDAQKGIGVADGRMGDCYDDGKVPVEFTRVDLLDITGKVIPIATPFTVKDGQLSSKACPAPPVPAKPAPPKPGKPAKPVPRDGTPTTPKEPGEPSSPPSIKPPATKPPSSGDKGRPPPGGEGGPGGDPKVPGRGTGGGGSGSPSPDLKQTFEFCPNLLDCRVGGFPVIFEEVGGDLAQGWFVLPGDPLFDPKRSGSIIASAANPNGVVRLKDRGDGSFDVQMLDSKDVLVVVGRAKALGDQFEMISGEALEQLKRALRAYLKGNRGPGVSRQRSTRMRFR